MPRVPKSQQKEAARAELFDIRAPWKQEWRGMPEFVQEDIPPFKSLQVHFASPEAVEEFAKLTGQTVNVETRSIWYPESELFEAKNLRFISES